MQMLKISGHFFAVLGLLVMAVFQLSKKSVDWPASIAANINYISFGSIILGAILKLLFYISAKNQKDAKEFVLFLILYIGLFFLLYFITN